MSTFVATPRCFIEIYPYEAGLYTVSIDQSSVLSCVVDKNIRSNEPGSFTIQFAPSGPQGTNYGKSWSEVLTPMSLVTIAMQRYKHAQIVMIGVITDVREEEIWREGIGVVRAIEITGADFQYFFNTFNYYNLTFLAATGSAFGTAGLPAVLNHQSLQGSPDRLGSVWYKDFMAGPNGILGSTYFNYKGTSTLFYDLMATWFEYYNQAILEVPMGDLFMVSEGSWWLKFSKIFPFPWYEFFVTTAPVNYYSGTAATTPVDLGTFPSASPSLVARMNPLPWTPVDSSGLFSMETTLWDDLTLYEVEGGNFESRVHFSAENVRNFYVLNPKWFSQLFGGSNNNNSPFVYTFSAWYDQASIHRYGYRPEIAELHWLSDITKDGVSAIKNASSPDSFKQMVDSLSLKMTSYYEPTPNMANAEAGMELRPDILPGNKFRYKPFKNQDSWDFYITGIQHNYHFGSQSSTKLTLTRGLPSSVYEDSQMLFYLHMGTAMRQNGQYVHGLPFGLGEGLNRINMSSPQFQQILGGIAPIFSSAQKK